MAWGGSLDKKDSDYIRKLRESDKVISFLEGLKNHSNHEERVNLSKTIEIIVKHISTISEKEIEALYTLHNFFDKRNNLISHFMNSL
jgi:hypothetical protein